MPDPNIYAYMSKPSKNGRRRYFYKNYATHEYSFDYIPGVEYKESKLVYRMTENMKRYEEAFANFKVLEPMWKRI